MNKEYLIRNSKSINSSKEFNNKLKEIIYLIKETHIDVYINNDDGKINQIINDVLKDKKINSKYDLYYYVNLIIKKIFDKTDSHTKMIFKDSSATLPVRLKWINNKVYIIRTDFDNQDLMYGKVLKINDIEVNLLIEEIKNMTAYSTEEFLRMPIEVTLRTVEKLKTLPSIDSNADEYKFEILKDNNLIKRNLKSNGNELLKINNMSKNYMYNIIDDKIQIIYNACKQDYDGQMNDFVKEIDEVSNINNINKFIVDIRGNTGGNSNVIKILIDFLKDKEVVTLVDEFVFSGGRFALIDLQTIGSKTVGTGIGTSINCFGNIEVIEYDDFLIPVSKKYFYYDDGMKEVTTKSELEKLDKKYFEPIIFKPDYYSENTIDDLKNNYDRQLDTAINLLNKKMWR